MIINIETARAAFGSVVRAISVDEARAPRCHAAIVVEGGVLTVWGTNGHWCARYRATVPDSCEEGKLLLHRDAVCSLIKAAGKAKKRPVSTDPDAVNITAERVEVGRMNGEAFESVSSFAHNAKAAVTDYPDVERLFSDIENTLKDPENRGSVVAFDPEYVVAAAESLKVAGYGTIMAVWVGHSDKDPVLVRDAWGGNDAAFVYDRKNNWSAVLMPAVCGLSMTGGDPFGEGSVT